MQALPSRTGAPVRPPAASGRRAVLRPVAPALVPWSATVAPGVRLHLFRGSAFTTTICRVVLHRDLGAEATATSLLAQVLQSATARHATREALAARLADLYGASLGVAVAKVGDRQVLTATLEWPTVHVPRARGLLPQGLHLLHEVLALPKRSGGAAAGRGGNGAPLDPDLVRTEQVNLVRALRSLADDKGRLAASRATEAACRGEPFAREPLGRVEEVAAATPERLGLLHARLLASAPADIQVVGDLAPREALAAVRRHLLWEGRSARPARLPPAASSRPARARPLRVREQDHLAQAQVVLAARARAAPASTASRAADVLAGVLGGGSFSRLFRVAREEHGLCYHAYALWNRAKGLLLAQLAVDPGQVGAGLRLARGLLAETARGALDPTALRGFREAVVTQTDALREDRSSLLAWHLHADVLGLHPDPAREVAAVLAIGPSDVRRVGRRLGLEVTYVLTPDGGRRGPSAGRRGR